MAVKFPQNHTWRQASFPSRSPKPTQATGWGLAVNVSGCAWASGSSSGGGSWGGACVQHLGQGRRPSPPAAAAHATRAGYQSPRSVHSPSPRPAALTFSPWESMAASCPERARHCQPQAPGLRPSCPGPQTLRDAVGGAEGVVGSPLAAGARGRGLAAGLRGRGPGAGLEGTQREDREGG